MSLEKQINDEIKAAMLAKEKVRLTALRAVKSEILLAKTADGSETIADGAVLKIVQKLVKQRAASRPPSIPKAVVPNWPRTNWPKPPNSKVSCLLQMSGVELESALKAIIEQVGAKAPSDMGKVMGVATKQLAGRADGRAISEAVKKLLRAVETSEPPEYAAWMGQGSLSELSGKGCARRYVRLFG